MISIFLFKLVFTFDIQNLNIDFFNEILNIVITSNIKNISLDITKRHKNKEGFEETSKKLISLSKHFERENIEFDESYKKDFFDIQRDFDNCIVTKDQFKNGTFDLINNLSKHKIYFIDERDIYIYVVYNKIQRNLFVLEKLPELKALFIALWIDGSSSFIENQFSVLLSIYHFVNICEKDGFDYKIAELFYKRVIFIIFNEDFKFFDLIINNFNKVNDRFYSKKLKLKEDIGILSVCRSGLLFFIALCRKMPLMVFVDNEHSEVEIRNVFNLYEEFTRIILNLKLPEFINEQKNFDNELK